MNQSENNDLNDDLINEKLNADAKKFSELLSSLVQYDETLEFIFNNLCVDDSCNKQDENNGGNQTNGSDNAASNGSIQLLTEGEISTNIQTSRLRFIKERIGYVLDFYFRDPSKFVTMKYPGEDKGEEKLTVETFIYVICCYITGLASGKNDKFDAYMLDYVTEKAIFGLEYGKSIESNNKEIDKQLNDFEQKLSSIDFTDTNKVETNNINKELEAKIEALGYESDKFYNSLTQVKNKVENDDKNQAEGENWYLKIKKRCGYILLFFMNALLDVMFIQPIINVVKCVIRYKNVDKRINQINQTKSKQINTDLNKNNSEELNGVEEKQNDNENKTGFILNKLKDNTLLYVRRAVFHSLFPMFLCSLLLGWSIIAYILLIAWLALIVYKFVRFYQCQPVQRLAYNTKMCDFVRTIIKGKDLYDMCIKFFKQESNVKIVQRASEWREQIQEKMIEAHEKLELEIKEQQRKQESLMSKRKEIEKMMQKKKIKSKTEIKRKNKGQCQTLNSAEKGKNNLNQEQININLFPVLDSNFQQQK